MNRATRLPISYHVITGPSQVSRHQGQHTASDQPHFFPLFPPSHPCGFNLIRTFPLAHSPVSPSPELPSSTPAVHSILRTSNLEVTRLTIQCSTFNPDPSSFPPPCLSLSAYPGSRHQTGCSSPLLSQWFPEKSGGRGPHVASASQSEA
jgi:hypothetical protein